MNREGLRYRGLGTHQSNERYTWGQRLFFADAGYIYVYPWALLPFILRKFAELFIKSNSLYDNGPNGRIHEFGIETARVAETRKFLGLQP